jgi:hypothetical protein
MGVLMPSYLTLEQSSYPKDTQDDGERLFYNAVLEMNGEMGDIYQINDVLWR